MKELQEIQDRNFELSVKRAALDQFEHWVKVYQWRKQTEGMEAHLAFFHESKPDSLIYVRNPLRFGLIYTIYDEASAKYLKASFNKMVEEEFQRLQNEVLSAA